MKVTAYLKNGEYIKTDNFHDLTDVYDIEELICENISTFEGIEYVNTESIRSLRCRGGNLTSLKPFSKVSWPSLTEFSCEDTQISSLDGIQGMNKLIFLYCPRNNLFSLDGIQGMQLSVLICSENQIKDIRIFRDMNFDNMRLLSCHENAIMSLDGIQGKTFPEIDEFDFGVNQINNIDILSTCTFNKNIGLINFSYNQLTNIDVIEKLGIEEITFLRCYGNQLERIPSFEDIMIKEYDCSNYDE